MSGKKGAYNKTINKTKEKDYMIITVKIFESIVNQTNLYSGSKMLGYFPCNSAPRSLCAMLRGKIVLQKIALTIGPNIAWREREGMINL